MTKIEFQELLKRMMGEDGKLTFSFVDIDNSENKKFIISWCKNLSDNTKQNINCESIINVEVNKNFDIELTEKQNGFETNYHLEPEKVEYVSEEMEQFVVDHVNCLQEIIKEQAVKQKLINKKAK